LGTSGGDHAFMYPIYDQLVGYDQKGNLDPSLSLAQQWEQPDPKTITLTLRTGIKFHDGSDFDAAAVKFNIDRVLDPNNHATPRSDLASIDSVETPDASHAVLHLKTPSAPLLTNFGDRGGMIVSSTAVNKLGKDNYGRQPSGTGPFVMKQWVTDTSLIYDRNPSYWRKDSAGRQLPYLQQIQLKAIPDATVRLATFEQGDTDISDAPVTEVKRLQADKRYQYTLFVGSSTGMVYINHTFPPFDNLMFRRAFSAALDRQNYIQNFLLGQEPQATGILTPADWAYDPTIKNYLYSPDDVKAFLQQSGLPQSQWRVKLQPFTSPISDGEQFWQKSLADNGIQVDWATPEVNGWAKHVLKGLGGDGSTAGYFSAFSLRVDPDGIIGQFYTQNGAYNAGQAPCPDTEDLVVQARQSYDQNERKKLYSQIQALGVQDQYSATLLYYSIALIFSAAKVGNFSAYYGGEGKAHYGNLWV
ncbi:MAG TPA: ABC transporter substrate-binding protein, partial [Dehalococcoidia bacterium]|nr:ABC transporter substrate-binding protein [Dehalococcoidia bacterium]